MKIAWTNTIAIWSSTHPGYYPLYSKSMVTSSSTVYIPNGMAASFPSAILSWSKFQCDEIGIPRNEQCKDVRTGIST